MAKKCRLRTHGLVCFIRLEMAFASRSFDLFYFCGRKVGLLI